MNKTTGTRKNLGDSGERIAAMFLEQRGDKIIARNWRSPPRAGELDMVAEDVDALAFGEVRARCGNTRGTLEESLTPRNREPLLITAQEFLIEPNEYADPAGRIDWVAIELDRAGKIARMEVIQSAIES